MLTKIMLSFKNYVIYVGEVGLNYFESNLFFDK